MPVKAPATVPVQAAFPGGEPGARGPSAESAGRADGAGDGERRERGERGERCGQAALGAGRGKVQPWHRDRLAAVRQSTAAQVQDYGESTRLPYRLAERAVTLGWAPSRVLVIDEDLWAFGIQAERQALVAARIRELLPAT